MAMDLSTIRLAVTGGGGMVGRALLARLQAEGCRDVAAPRSRDYDLRSEAAVQRFYADFRPEVVIHLAAAVGGIGANRDQPARFFYDNAVMGIQLLEHARRCGVRKFVAIGSVCSYPHHTPAPFREEHLWDGYPEPTNAPYGLAKKMLLVQCQAYREQYGFNAIYLIPVNLYGPYDNFSLETSHVIPALLRKCDEARRAQCPELTLWGDGTPTREFLFVEDAADGIVRATREYDDPEPVNLGSGEEISIRDLADRIAALTGYRGRLTWDPTRPNGQPRRCVDTSRASCCFGFEARTSLDEGLRRTYEWYLQHADGMADNKHIGT